MRTFWAWLWGLVAENSTNLNVIMTASKNILSRTDNAYLLLIEETRSTSYAEREQNPCKLGKRMCTNCRQYQMAKPAKPARSMALGQPKKKWRLFHAKHEIRTKKLRHVDIPHESVNKYDWLAMVTILSTIFQLAGAFASRFKLFSMKKSNILHSQQHNRYLFRQPFSIIFQLLQQCFASDAAKRPQS